MNKSTKQLSQSIYQYYCDNFDSLSLWKKVHFATRLSNWDEDIFCRQKIADLKSEVLRESDAETVLTQLYQKYVGLPPKGTKNAAEIRLPYFQKYPQLQLINIILFRALVYMKSYDIDCRAYINRLFPDDSIGNFLATLYSDETAVAILSTHAINTQYLYRRLIQQSDYIQDFDPAAMYEIGQKSYDLSDKTQLKLYIYFYTHCIIGESLFYTRRIPEKFYDIYLAMINDLETVIDEYFEDINLDNKCEYLTCCNILGVTSKVRDRIELECQASVSDQGTFLIDRLNNNPQIDSTDFNKSEHRNVLYIMANRPYRPQDTV